MASLEVPVECRPAPLVGGWPAPLSGALVNTIFQSRGESGINFGSGFASVQPGKDGVFRFAGSLADGTKLSGMAKTVEDGEGGWKLPVAIPLSSVKGLLHGEAPVNSAPDVDELHISANDPWTWSRPANTKAKSFAAGFEEELDVFGKVWTWTKGTSALGGNSANFTLMLSAPMGAATAVGADSFSLKIVPTTGLVSGKVPATQGGKALILPYQGILFSENVDTGSAGPVLGAGFVTGNGSSGMMEISQP